jgi:predicted DCC family thiol-disulfide oxidoreductase YuxK
MKTNTHILLYDDYCPLCTWYSGLFVKLGLLNPENRVPFSKADIEILTAIDIEKGKDEIPLYEKETGKTLYGIDALLEILGQNCKLIKPIGNLKPLNWFLKKLYKLISYNRKVIVAKKCGTGSFDCSPGFNVFYRMLFMSIFLLFNSFMLFPLHKTIFSSISFYHLDFFELQAAHLLFVAVNCTIAVFLNPKKGIEYLGQINMLAVICILLLTLLLFLLNTFLLPEWMIFFYLALLTVLIIKEYFRRMKYLNLLPGYKTIIILNLFCLAGFLGYVFH